MYINLKKTLSDIERHLPDGREPTQKELCQAYLAFLLLRSQVLAVLRDQEDFERVVGLWDDAFASQMSKGELCGKTVTLTIQEPLPTQKEPTPAVEEHWVDMMCTAFRKAAGQGPLPHFQKAMVEILIATPRGSDNTEGMGYLQPGSGHSQQLERSFLSRR